MGARCYLLCTRCTLWEQDNNLHSWEKHLSMGLDWVCRKCIFWELMKHDTRLPTLTHFLWKVTTRPRLCLVVFLRIVWKALNKKKQRKKEKKRSTYQLPGIRLHVHPRWSDSPRLMMLCSVQTPGPGLEATDLSISKAGQQRCWRRGTDALLALSILLC